MLQIAPSGHVKHGYLLIEHRGPMVRGWYPECESWVQSLISPLALTCESWGSTLHNATGTYMSDMSNPVRSYTGTYMEMLLTTS